MFYNCYSLTSLDVSNFDTSKVTSLSKMFYSCISLSSLNLSNFNTNSIEDISSIFENCNKLEYVNFYPLTSNKNMNINNMFLGTPDMFIYCLNDDKKNEEILSQLESKDCKYKDCLNDLEKSKENRFENLKKTIEIFNDKCFFKSLQFMSNEFIISDNIPNISIYFYEIDSNINKLASLNTNLTFIYFTKEVIDNIKDIYNLNEETDIYILIMDLPSNDSKTVTSDYDYKFILENGTELDLNSIKEDIYVNISVPIRDLNSSNFDYAINFADQGYDIYDIKSEFYNDLCTSAYINGNDIILKDRVNEIYPSNITLCKDNCEYKGVSIEEQKIICECNLNRNRNYSYDNEDNTSEEEDANFINYFLDNINYKIFK
jgi:surface protein